ncbi:TPR/MLP1/MLP2-like protein [Pleurostoma richardsiae]|uniref:TPR/MLP1/MLP2-like protein n=1 Tax=Pleurostoma richardsiae TaxID=41990 RepID=A0AA38VU68_9PEZI|nr:TPR/MLP1/MLP2-like protein [Pleurostoma richardsiae]
MRFAQLRLLLPLGFTASWATAAEVVYVTDLSIFTYLAPCAASAVSQNIQALTYDHCPEAVTDLQGCVCTKDNNFASISSGIQASVSYSCGSTASDDVASAQTVLTAYCNQNSIPTFPTPTSPVSQLITDVPEFEYLAPCAASGLSLAVGTLTWELCPEEPTALATCACSKNQNSLLVSQMINSNVKYSCASHSADITSAQEMFAAYCAMGNGTTSFPTPTDPPGHMTYYITALTQFAALAPCAASAVSQAVAYQTWDLCPDGAEALASCACIKESMSGSISNSVTSNVKYSCSSTASEDITSALSVFDFYCQAARAEVTAAGVTDSVTETSPTARGATGGTGSGTKSTSTASNSGSGSGSGSGGGSSGDGSSGSSSGSSGSGSGSSSSSSSSPNTAVIAGAVVGVVVGLGLIGAIVFYLMWNARRRRAAKEAAAAAAAAAPPGGPEFAAGTGKPELAGTAIASMPPPPPSPSPSALKAGASPRTDSVSPVSAGPYPPPQAGELHGNYPAPPPELHGNHNMPPELRGQMPAPYPPPGTSELQGQHSYPQPQGAAGGQRLYGQPDMPGGGGQQRPVHEVHGQGAVWQADSRPVVGPRAELQGGMGYQAGPVGGYHELDGAGYGGGYGQAR